MAFKTKYLKQKEKLDDYTFKHSLWNRFEEHELSENQANFLSQCMSENLEHARHVENERLTFNSIFLALVLHILFSNDSGISFHDTYCKMEQCL